MSQDVVITPDIKFVRELKAAGGDTMKKCYQCATCSVVCPISPNEKPFPRKEMVMAQWGMKDELLADPDIWLCHNCNDCSKYCPRGARPGDVLGALRKKAIQMNAFPSFMGNIVTEPKMLPVALAIPLIIFLIVLGSIGTLGIPDGEIVYSKLFPILSIELIFGIAALFAMVSMTISIRSFWRSINAEPFKLKLSGMLISSLIATVIEFMQHKKFEKCEPNADRRIAHMLVVCGFVGLFITTLWITYLYYIPQIHSPILLSNPMKWLGNLSAVSLLAGIILIVVNRLKDKGVTSVTSSFDWTFIAVVILVGVTGLLTELIRLADIAAIAYLMYFIHLIFVFYIIAYFPYSKLAHMVYRTVAIAHAKQAKRDVEL